MRLVSFDVATKSLAVAIIDYTDNDALAHQIKLKLNEYKQQKQHSFLDKLMAYGILLKKTNEILNSKYLIKYLDVRDLIPGKKVKEVKPVEVTYYLHKYLEEIRQKILDVEPGNLHFVIEYQMGPNDKTRGISSQLMLYCMSFFKDDHGLRNIRLLGPSLKNKLSFIGDDQSKHRYYTAKYKTNYTANKNHTKYIMKKFLAAYNQSEVLADIKKKNLDDAADAICMILAITATS